MKKATERQLKLIRDIELNLDVKFSGESLGDATEFITNNMNDYREIKESHFDLIYNQNNY